MHVSPALSHHRTRADSEPLGAAEMTKKHRDLPTTRRKGSLIQLSTINTMPVASDGLLGPFPMIHGNVLRGE